MNFMFGIDRLLSTSDLMNQLHRKKVGLVAHPASITSGNYHTLDALINNNCNIVKAFGPQHGMRGDKQDNMIESSDYLDPLHQVPIVSLYGTHRRPTEEMIRDLDVILFDLQDIGCRIYTYITTLKYFVEACCRYDCELMVLDRPNPAGRPVDGLRLEKGEESFVGCDELPTRHGLTVGELAGWFNSRQQVQTNLKVINMQGYAPDSSPGYGWPIHDRPWVNPSPNAASLNMSRCFPGTVLLEGTNLSEGRGTTIPLEVVGAPSFPVADILSHMNENVPDWITGVFLRPCFFEPTFHKHMEKMCAGIQVHTDYLEYEHENFKPYRLIAGILKSLKQVQPEYKLWRHHEYEYEPGRIPIDVINGGSGLRDWVDDDTKDFDDLESILQLVEQGWLAERKPYLLY